MIERVDRIERALRSVPHVTANSALSVFRRAKAGFEPTAAQAVAFRQFVTGTDLFRKRGLVGDRYLAIGLKLDVTGSVTIVSPMVPMTILVTATATLVYLHSRFVERPVGRSVDAHQLFALTNKFVACTASIFARRLASRR